MPPVTNKLPFPAIIAPGQRRASWVCEQHIFDDDRIGRGADSPLHSSSDRGLAQRIAEPIFDEVERVRDPAGARHGQVASRIGAVPQPFSRGLRPPLVCHVLESIFCGAALEPIPMEACSSACFRRT
jgi:hypothetical protein